MNKRIINIKVEFRFYGKESRKTQGIRANRGV